MSALGTGLFSFLSVVYILPIVVVLLNSFKKKSYINLEPFKAPNETTFAGLDNYTAAIDQYGFLKAVGWTVFITVGSVAAILICTSMCAWYITRVQNRITKGIYLLCVFSMVVPFQMVMFTLSLVTDRLGLGTPTGVEVSESTGRLTTKEDANYTASLEVQAAIGQGNTVVTPVQLATYAATIANKGVRYRTHFVKALLDTNTGEVLEETAPEVVEIIPDEVGAFDIVEEGMVGAAQTVAGLANYPYTIACKTGTPQRSEYYMVGSRRQYYTNSTIIAYGPVEDPQIAVGIVVEYGGGGSRTGELVADIFNAYFFERSNGMTPVQEGQLLE